MWTSYRRREKLRFLAARHEAASGSTCGRPDFERFLLSGVLKEGRRAAEVEGGIRGVAERLLLACVCVRACHPSHVRRTSSWLFICWTRHAGDVCCRSLYCNWTQRLQRSSTFCLTTHREPVSDSDEAWSARREEFKESYCQREWL